MRIIITGDTGTGSTDQYLVARGMEDYSIKNKMKKGDGIILLGDNIYESGVTSLEDKQFNSKFEDPYINIDLPFYLCLGNHDYGNDYFTQNAFTNYAKHQIEYTKYSKKWNMPKRYYSISKGPCEFFFIDTNIDLMSQKVAQQQLKTMKNKIKKSKKKWKILCGHHTWRSTGGHGNAEPILEDYLSKLVSGTDICAYFCGHDHCKNVITMPFPKEKKRKTISKRKKQREKLYLFVIGTGGKRYDDSFMNSKNITSLKDNHLLYQNSQLGFIGLHATQKNIKIDLYDVDENGYQLVRSIDIH